MSNTNLVLGSNWTMDEWPEYVAVSHEGTCDGMRVYVPERTCTVASASKVTGLEKATWDLRLYSCSACRKTSIDLLLGYCPHCGAKVVE